MTPIINPWIFYLMHLINGLHIVSIICTAIFAILLLGIVLFLFFFWEENEDEDDGFFKHTKKSFKPTLIFLIISLSIFIITPDKKTTYTMLIANYITENNIEAGKEEVKEIIDYVVDKLDNKDEDK